jgi:Zn-dependent protease
MINKNIKLGFIKTSKTELVDIAKAWMVLSLAFTFVYTSTSLIGGRGFSGIFSSQFLLMFVVSLFTAGIGFLLHELAHKLVAQHYGCTAEFRAFDQMLYLALGLAVLVGFIFAAPGAVMIAGQVTRKENGIISLAGPLTNFILGLIFLGLNIIYPAYTFIFQTGFLINFWLGLFNMIPFGNFDGLKILHWSRFAWGMMVVVGVYFVFFQNIL